MTNAAATPAAPETPAAKTPEQIAADTQKLDAAKDTMRELFSKLEHHHRLALIDFIPTLLRQYQELFY